MIQIFATVADEDGWVLFVADESAPVSLKPSRGDSNARDAPPIPTAMTYALTAKEKHADSDATHLAGAAISDTFGLRVEFADCMGHAQVQGAVEELSMNDGKGFEVKEIGRLVDGRGNVVDLKKVAYCEERNASVFVFVVKKLSELSIPVGVRRRMYCCQHNLADLKRTTPLRAYPVYPSQSCRGTADAFTVTVPYMSANVPDRVCKMAYYATCIADRIKA